MPKRQLVGMKIYSGPISAFGAKAEIAAHEKNVEFDLELVPFSLSTFYEPKHPDVVRINPKHQVPVLVDGDLEIFDSTQIFEYLEHTRPSPALWPNDPKLRARARLLELSVDEVLMPNIVQLFPHNRMTDGEEKVAAALAIVNEFYARMERELGERDFFTGDLSYADVGFYCVTFLAHLVGAPFGEAHPHLRTWRDRMAQRPSVKRVMGRMVRWLKEQGLEPPNI
jgi:glutathione S-transferase